MSSPCLALEYFDSSYPYPFSRKGIYLFVYISLVCIRWKSQSPWPALRGALYDPYLAQTGGYYGVKRARNSHSSSPDDAHANTYGDGLRDVSEPALHVQLNLLTWAPMVLNKQSKDYIISPKSVLTTNTNNHGGPEPEPPQESLSVRVEIYDLRGEFIRGFDRPLPGSRVAAQQVLSLAPVPFPRDVVPEATPVLVTLQLLRLTTTATTVKTGFEVLAKNVYLQSDPAVSPQSYGQLGHIRQNHSCWVHVDVTV